MLNAASLIAYASGIRRAFGTTAGYWYIAFQASQFHIIYYASRTLPNTFAFGISTFLLPSSHLLLNMLPGTFALSCILPDPAKQRLRLGNIRLAIYLLTLAAVIFRLELSLLLCSNAILLLFSVPDLHARIYVLSKGLLPAVVLAAVVGLGISVPIDTFFWQSPTPLWPELSAFISNVFPSKGGLGASAWGTSPWHWYFTSAIPRLLLNPLTLVLLPLSLTQPATRLASLNLLMPNILYSILYSFLPHKETRFLFPIVPPITAAAAIGAAYVFNHRHRNQFYRFLTYALILSTLLTGIISHAILLPFSSLGYPGAHALLDLHTIVARDGPSTAHVHLDNLALQTGVTRFLQMPPDLVSSVRAGSSLAGRPGASNTHWFYDKTDNVTDLLNPLLWDRFDYAVMEDPALAVGSWQPIHSIYGPGRPRLLRPGDTRGPVRMDDGLCFLIDRLYGFPAARLYKVFREIVREGWGLHWLFGDRGWSWTGGWWAEVGLVEKLHILKRGQGPGFIE